MVVARWLNFLVLTIAGERLELSHFLPPSANVRWVFLLIVLHVSLVLRLVGDGMNAPTLTARGGPLNALALALFILVTLVSVIRGLRLSPPQSR